jgi:hypothetical protein
MTGILNNPEIRLIYDISDFETGADRVIKKMNEIDDENEKTNDSVQKEMKETVKATEEINTEMAESVNQVKDLSKERKKEAEQLRSNIKDYKLFGVSINDVLDRYNGLKTGLTGTVQEFKALTAAGQGTTGVIGLGTKALKLFRLALIGTGIGALIVALGSLVAFFTRTQRGIDAVNTVLAGFGATVDVIIDRASSLGESLINAFKQPQAALSSLWENTKNFFSNPVDGIKSLFNGAKDAAAGLVEEIKNEAAAARDLEKRRQNLIKVERDLRIETAQTRAEVKRLNKDAEDTTKSIEQRAAAARQAVSIEQGLLEQRLSLAEQELAITREQNALGESLNADLEKEADLVVTIANLKTESLELQTTLQNKLNILTQQEIAQRQQLQDLYNSLYDGLKERVAAQEIELEDNPLIKLEKQQARALEGLQAQKDELVKLAKATGGDVAGVIDAYDQLAEGIKEQFNKKIETELNRIDPKVEIDDIEITLDEDVNFDFTEVPEELNFGEKIEAFKSKLFESLKLTPEDVAIIEDSFSQLFNLAFTDTTLLDTRIEKNREYRQSLRTTTEQLENELDEQLKLQDQGLDNNVKTVQTALAKQRQLEEQATREAEELQKQRAKAELIGQISAQVGNLTTAATKIFSAYAGIPFAGIALALGSIATMYSSYKQFKEQTQAEVRLYKGTTAKGERVGDYFGHVKKGGQSDIPGRGSGYRVLNTPVILGGNEFISTEAAAATQEAFLIDLNRNPGKYKNVDIAKILKHYDENKLIDKTRERYATVNSTLKDTTNLKIIRLAPKNLETLTAISKNYATSQSIINNASAQHIEAEKRNQDETTAKIIEGVGDKIVKAIHDRPHWFAVGDSIYKKSPYGTDIKKAATR